jgi:hypothetical protein
LPSVGARFRGHVKQRDRARLVDDVRGDRARPGCDGVVPHSGSGVPATDSVRGYLRKRRNMRGMRTTLERIKDVVEAWA